MQRIRDTTAAAALPAPPALTGPAGYFTGGAPGTVPATRVRYWWLNMLQEELLSILTAAGITPDTTGTNFHQVLDAIRAGAGGATRYRLSAATTFYVSPAGNDANTGMTPATAFRTLGACWVFLTANIDCAGQTVTISLADGTYPSAALLWSLVGQNEAVYITGNTTTPGNVVISSATNDALVIAHTGRFQLSGMRFQSSAPSGDTYTGAGSGLVVTEGSLVSISRVEFGNCTTYQMAIYGGYITTLGLPYSIVGGASCHLVCNTMGNFTSALSTVTITGTPNFTQFLFAAQNSVASTWGMTFSGGCTGMRWQAATGAIIDIHGANPDTYFPGTINGNATGGAIVQ